jgi:hypothetical protein
MSLEECVERPRIAFRAIYLGGMKLSRLYDVRILCDRAQGKFVAPEDACATSPLGVIASQCQSTSQPPTKLVLRQSRQKSVWSGPQALVDWVTPVFLGN